MSSAVAADAALEAWEDGFRIIAWRLNEILDELQTGLHVQTFPPRNRDTLPAAALRLSNALLSIRPSYPELPKDDSLHVWTLGHVNGVQNSQYYITLSIDEEANGFHLDFLRTRWVSESVDRWQRCIVAPIENHAREWRQFFKGFTAQDLPAQKFLAVDLRELSGLGASSVRNYLKLAGVKRAASGERNHEYSRDEVKKFLQVVIDRAVEEKVRLRCRASLSSLK